jgi:transposase InsO family protein
MEQRAMSLKMEFVEKALLPGARMAALCRQYGISRETGYKWLNRYKREGPNGLEELSRRPKSSPLATAEDVVVAIIEMREKYPRRGPRKLRLLLERKLGDATPSVATIARVLGRLGLARQRSRFRRYSLTLRAPAVLARECNEIWTVDFKGWWRTKDGERCEPLTVRDAFSRFVLAVEVLPSTAAENVRHVFERLFKRYGVPKRIHVDNGTPFINVLARGGLTRLSAWWISLGIAVQRSRPGCPQDNGAHERMHRDMSDDLQSFPAGSLGAEQRACDRWRQEFNHVRPHDALGGKVPADVYRRSERKAHQSRYLYPAGWLVRSVSDRGNVSVDGQTHSVGLGLARYRVAFEPLAGGLEHRLWFRNVELGTVQLGLSNNLVDELAENHQLQHRTRKGERRAA